MIATLLSPTNLWTREEILAPGAIPQRSGVYACYFSAVPPGVPEDGCHRVDGHVLLAIGSVPAAPRADLWPSVTLAGELRRLYRSNAARSPLRLHLGCLLGLQLGIHLRRITTGRQMTFGRMGETLLSRWLAAQVRVAWLEHPAPWEFGPRLAQLVLPLSLAWPHPFHAELAAIVERATALANRLPVME